eukprot:m51a1_g4232 hypothetical protein (435) ;mRNA; r:124397-125944
MEPQSHSRDIYAMRLAIVMQGVAVVSMFVLLAVPVLSVFARRRLIRTGCRRTAPIDWQSAARVAVVCLAVSLAVGSCLRIVVQRWSTVSTGLGPSAVEVAALTFAGAPARGSYLFNPSLAWHNGTLFVSARESTTGGCPSLAALAVRLWRTPDSRTLVGRLALPPSAPSPLAALALRPPRAELALADDADEVAARGVRDTRLIPAPSPASRELYATSTINGRLHLSVLAMGDGSDGSGEAAEEVLRVRVQPRWRGAEAARLGEWAHVPVEAGRHGALVFAASLDPLQLAEVSTSNGWAASLYRSPRPPSTLGLRACTNFLRHPRRPGAYWALARERGNPERLRLVEVDGPGGAWRLARVSERVALPLTREERRRGAAARGATPMSVAYEDERSMRSVLVGVGRADCTAHVVRVATAALMELLERGPRSSAEDER